MERVLKPEVRKLPRSVVDKRSAPSAATMYDPASEGGVAVFAGSQTIIGRAEELEDLSAFLSDVESGPAALVLEGEIGIGKTVLWKAGLAEATDRSYRVLICRPIESEAQVAYAALGDLLAEVSEETMGGLPDPQRRALEMALLRREPEGEPLQRAVALGALGVLRTIASERPTVIGIDDVQWLDQESESVLVFVARRLKDERIGVLATRRSEGPSTSLLDLEQAFVDGHFGRLRIESLGRTELDRLLVARLDAHLSEQLLVRVHDRSEGNPFFALEIARAMQHGSDLDSADDLPIPSSLHEIVRDRLALLPRPAREATEVASALSRPTRALIDSVTGSRDSAETIDAAATAGIVELEADRVRFTHPLLASITYAQIPPAQRRAMHARLAEILDDPEERGRHLALATERPDAAVAAALDEAARRARARGAPASAAELWEQARRLTPVAAGDEARRRGVEAAERHFDAGEVDRARVLLEEIVAESTPGRERSEALTRLGWVCAHTQGFHAAEEVFLAALTEHAEDIARRIEIEEGLAWCLHQTQGIAASQIHARTALELAESVDEPALLVGALSHVAFLDALSGEGIPLPTIERAVALDHSPQWSQIFGRPDWIHAMLLEWAGELRVSHAHFEALHQAAVDRGDEHALAFILYHLARIELLTGDWERAGKHARESREATVQNELIVHLPFSLSVEALVDAHLGLVDSARTKIAEGRKLADERGTRSAGFELLATLGFLELSLGNAREADEALGRLAAAVDESGLREPALFRFHGDAIEAKITLGQLDEVEALLVELDRLGATLERPWVLIMACRGRALLGAARGDLGASHRELEHALVLHDRLDEPFERARTLVLLGNVLRRARKKRSARDALESALEIFGRLGAVLWEQKTRAELARVGGRAPSTAELTPTEERIARLIASGLSYRETADALFISPKTVQWNLSKIYRKLDIRSRTELPARLAPEHGTSSQAGSSQAEAG